METHLGLIYTESRNYERHHTAGLKLLNLMGIKYLGNVPKIKKSPSGRPELDEKSGIDFNISHSGFLAACSIASGYTGCDIQYMARKTRLETARKFFHQQEYNFIMNQPSDEMKICSFYIFWTLKEAYLKLLGQSVTQMNTTPVFTVGNGTITSSFIEKKYHCYIFKSEEYVLTVIFSQNQQGNILIPEKMSDNIPQFKLVASGLV